VYVYISIVYFIYEYHAFDVNEQQQCPFNNLCILHLMRLIVSRKKAIVSYHYW